MSKPLNPRRGYRKPQLYQLGLSWIQKIFRCSSWNCRAVKSSHPYRISNSLALIKIHLWKATHSNNTVTYHTRMCLQQQRSSTAFCHFFDPALHEAKKDNFCLEGFMIHPWISLGFHMPTANVCIRVKYRTCTETVGCKMQKLSLKNRSICRKSLSFF